MSFSVLIVIARPRGLRTVTPLQRLNVSAGDSDDCRRTLGVGQRPTFFQQRSHSFFSRWGRARLGSPGNDAMIEASPGSGEFTGLNCNRTRNDCGDYWAIESYQHNIFQCARDL
jgi:hypothetical protein